MAKNERKKKTTKAVRKGPSKTRKGTTKKPSKTTAKRKVKVQPVAKDKIRVRKTSSRKTNKQVKIRSGVRSRTSELAELQELFLQALQKREQRRVQRVSKKKGKRKSQKETSDRSKHRTSKGAEIRMERKAGDNLIYIKFKTKSMQKLIIGLNNHDFAEFEQMTIPITEFAPYYLVVILKIKKPNQKEPYYMSFKSNVLEAISEVDLMKDFVIKTVSEYNNNMADLIDEKYDEPVQVYKIQEIGVRFIYPVIPQQGKQPLVIS